MKTGLDIINDIKNVEKRLNEELAIPTAPLNRKQRRALASHRRRVARKFNKILKETLKD